MQVLRSIGSVGILVSLCALVVGCGSDSSVSVGDIAELCYEDKDAPSWLAINGQVFDKMIEAATANDYTGLEQMESVGLIYKVQPGSQAEALDVGVGNWKVRIKEGPHTGRAGWVVAEYVQSSCQ